MAASNNFFHHHSSHVKHVDSCKHISYFFSVLEEACEVHHFTDQHQYLHGLARDPEKQYGQQVGSEWNVQKNDVLDE
ncbi:hypothetical protein LR48_Vigan2318s000100 [Vigna angularis]|nr:hypothetical protein LR48_Vigan2318s000100 [Vigna angularis]